MKTVRRIAKYLGAALVLAAATAQAGDLLRVHNTATKQIGALVDGNRDSILINDGRYLRLDLGGFFSSFFPVVPLDNLSSEGGQNEVIAFARLRPPILLPDVPWTAFDDTVDVTFDDEYQFPVTIWIVASPFETGPKGVAHTIERVFSQTRPLDASLLAQAEILEDEFNRFSFLNLESDQFFRESILITLPREFLVN